MVEVTLLDILWQKGFIHGYSIFDKYCHIFLKYNLAGYGLLESVVLVNYNLSNKELRNSFHLNYYCGYITMSSKKKIHYYSGNRFLNLNESSFSGELIAKI
jgi:ribosomal protein S8